MESGASTPRNEHEHGSNVALLTDDITPTHTAPIQTTSTTLSPTPTSTATPAQPPLITIDNMKLNYKGIFRRSTSGSQRQRHERDSGHSDEGPRRTGTFSSLLTPSKKVGPSPTMFQSFRSILCSSWINLLLLCIPVSWVLNFATDNDTLIFVFSFLAIIPLAKLLAFATDELSMRVGQTLAGLLNATLGNAVELIVAIIALTQCKLHIVQSSLIGSMLSNLLLVLGMCFFAGGVRFSEQGFGLIASQLNSSLLTIAVIAILLPAAFYYNVTTNTDSDEGQDLLKVSHGVALILLFIYAAYLVFQLYSHAALYNDENDIIKSTKYAPRPKKTKSSKSIKSSVDISHPDASNEGVEMHVLPSASDLAHEQHYDLDNREEGTSHGRTSPPATPTSSKPLIGRKAWDTASTAAATFTSVASLAGGRHSLRDVEKGLAPPAIPSANGRVNTEGEAEEEQPQMNLLATVVLLAVVTALVSVTAEWLVDSIDGLTDTGAITQEFVGIILLPIVGNAAEHVTAVTVSVKDKLTLSLGVAVGSTLQIALFVIPFIVTLGWIMGKPLTLLFDPYESITLFLAVLTVNYSVQDGKSNWLEGMILMCLYIILCVTFWYYPGSDPSGLLNTCT
ncbi:Sodium/calcium exchanger protein-domain-containing protein [Lentinula detonsa]|uniref:Sodium/calcium exchanger protein-domain-containing protein n=1 Tax=Lentinula detonsa TaxID=2804962 RepID=A0A9W8P7H8_9AGAR|nr:Sodium/calcium exchanger protein-domain-containing protein [Lentinula detonsa]